MVSTQVYKFRLGTCVVASSRSAAHLISDLDVRFWHLIAGNQLGPRLDFAGNELRVINLSPVAPLHPIFIVFALSDFVGVRLICPRFPTESNCTICTGWIASVCPAYCASPHMFWST